ncbi:MAG: YdcF family protein [Treponema sp.]|nr:YdcF family protein [Treponema sp.]
MPEENIICEKESKGTWDNIKNVKKIMEENKMETAVIVTNTGHIRRASIYTKEMGIKHTVERSALPKGANKIYMGIIYLHLYYGIFKYLIHKKQYIK